MAHENVTDDQNQLDGRATIARLAEDVLPMLIERLTRSDLGELEVRENGWRIRLRRPVPNGRGLPRQTRQPHPVMASGTHVPAHGAPYQPPREASRGLIASPAVGYFAPRNGVEIGEKLRSGDLVGHVDVLGVRHEVVSPVDGALRGFEVESGQAVEFGQAIARVEAEV